MEEILRLLPEKLQESITNKLNHQFERLEEIRLRLYHPIELNFHDKIIWLEDVTFSREDSIYVLNQLSQHSLYRMQDELKEGYITTSGGHRVGLAGEVSTENGKVKQLQYITYFNIRIAKEIKNISLPFIPFLKNQNAFYNTLIIGAPQTGKTTLLRDLARLIGDGTSTISAQKVGIVDERSEIAASHKGVPQHQIGSRTDVMDACPKIEGLMMMIRSMSPDVLIIDEIGKKEDVQALMEAITAGVTIICSIHGQSLDEINKRPSLQHLLSQQVFKRFIILKRMDNHFFSIHITNQHGQDLITKKVRKQ